jgi:hypothetical protein
MYVLKAFNFGYIAHPKTASSATSRVLRELGAEVVGNHHSVEEGVCQQILDSGGIVMAAVRNPFDLMVSWYFHYKQRRGITANDMASFATWLPQQLSNPNQYVRKGLFYGLKWANRVLWFEHLQDDFNDVMSELGLPPTFIGPFNISRFREGRPYQKMYTPELVDLVRGHCQSELDMTGYTYEE